MSIENGRLYGLFLGTSVPTLAHDSGDGVYAACGLVTSLSVSEAINIVDTTNKDDGNDSSSVGGHSVWTVSVGARFDAADDTGQAKVTTSAESVSRNIWFLITTDVIADLEWYGKANVSSREYSFGDDESTEFTFTMQVTGTMTQGAVT